jgi:hypothetical protein
MPLDEEISGALDFLKDNKKKAMSHLLIWWYKIHHGMVVLQEMS